MRGGFVVSSPDAAEQVLAELKASGQAEVFVERWDVREELYFDRAALLRFPDGIVAEVQLWEPALLEAKSRGGHDIYKRLRVETDPARREELKLEMMRHYAEVEVPSEFLPILSQAFNRLSENPAWTQRAIASLSIPARTREPSQRTSTELTASQPSSSPPSAVGLSTQADISSEDTTAGRPSQSYKLRDILASYVGNLATDAAPRNELDAHRTLDQPACHGTPHRFERFSLNFMGSGEGAQAFGEK